MNYTQWKLFLDANDLGSLSKVAQFYNTSQPQISRQLQELEDFCGGRLFHRTGRGVTLTDLGLFLLPKIRHWIKLTEQLQNDIHHSSKNLIGKVRIGSIPSTAHPLLTAVSHRLKEEYPQIELSVREGQGVQLEKWLEEGSVDLSLLYRFQSSSQNGDLYLAEVDTYLVGKKEDPLLKNTTIDFAQLDGLPLVTFCRPSSWVSHLETIARQKQIALNIAFEADSISMQMHLIESGRYYGILSPQAIKNHTQDQKLAAVKIVQPNIKRYLSLSMSPHTYLTPPCRKVIDIIKDILKSGDLDFSSLNEDA
ncbi:LysR family transcriptional regulator [Acinetobacter sp. MB5]|uniref:LysR family transcriptional regulator n=1 Tax=Acinetobacter sp. MB5 TaxID=2069438 RepID=UPI000DD083A1|nr:LysR family transcriptional regulator [Acinetobacter sp. MB5]